MLPERSVLMSLIVCLVVSVLMSVIVCLVVRRFPIG
jgi:hypothetical protein